jgi:hypothetical protein
MREEDIDEAACREPQISHVQRVADPPGSSRSAATLADSASFGAAVALTRTATDWRQQRLLGPGGRRRGSCRMGVTDLYHRGPARSARKLFLLTYNPGAPRRVSSSACIVGMDAEDNSRHTSGIQPTCECRRGLASCQERDDG